MIFQWIFRFKRLSNPNIVQVQLDTVLLFSFPIIGKYIFTGGYPTPLSLVRNNQKAIPSFAPQLSWTNKLMPCSSRWPTKCMKPAVQGMDHYRCRASLISNQWLQHFSLPPWRMTPLSIKLQWNDMTSWWCFLAWQTNSWNMMNSRRKQWIWW